MDHQHHQNKLHSQLLIATTNRGKLAEYRELFANLAVDLIDLPGAGITAEVPETGATFEENARLKAREYAVLSGLPTLADDSGLEIMALNGQPGVYSARYGGPELDDIGRYQLVLQQLQGIPFHDRLARFVCVIAIATPAGVITTVEGSVGGVIEFEPRGTGGFGYDPIFLLLDRGVTMAELPAAEKNQISHRAQAARKAIPILHQLFNPQNIKAPE
jgi:XTP/dITP diphosphohydrolase